MLYRVFTVVVDFYAGLILIYILMSWFPRRPGGLFDDIYGAFGAICEPYLGLFRRIIPPIGMIDFSPVVAILVLEAIRMLIGAILI